MWVNGHRYRAPDDFTLSVQTVSWGNSFVIENDDQIEFTY
jgi:hypothetical protein